ncbi:hypothetical protein F5051DRAFT_488002 [Lentinula edodes]|nr:hypothetical protein F5051DRAFT_488002 [Lentinula edodes]
MYIKYKEVGKFVDETKSGREMPTKERIAGYTDVTSTLEKLPLLEKQMFQAKEILDALQARTFDLHMVNNPAREWVKSFRTTPLIATSSKDEDLLAIKSITNSIEPTPQNEQQRRIRA